MQIIIDQYNSIDIKSHTKFSYDDIDKVIINRIDEVTAEDSDIWTCPDFNRRQYAHGFFQYPAMMIPIVQKKLVDIIVSADPSIKNMFDPFMGSATTMVACMEYGLNCYGQDVNPLAVLIAKTRTGPFFVNALKEKYVELILQIKNDSSKKIETNFSAINKWFKPNVAIELSKISRNISKIESLSLRRFFWVILAETIRVSSNDRTSTFKLHMRPKEEIEKRNFSALKVFELHVEQSIIDYDTHANQLKILGQLEKGRYKSIIDIKLWDSKQNISNPSDNILYDLLVTSPPYGDNKTTVTYGQHSYLPLQWINLKDIDENASLDFLRTTSEIDSRSLGGKLKEFDFEKLSELFLLSPALKRTYELIENKDPKKVKKVGVFFLDLNKSIDNIFKVMKINSYQIWTIGNRRVADIEIPNAKILTELFEKKGCKLIKQLERNILNKRMAIRNNSSSLMTKEDILIFRKIG